MGLPVLAQQPQGHHESGCRVFAERRMFLAGPSGWADGNQSAQDILHFSIVILIFSILSGQLETPVPSISISPALGSVRNGPIALTD